MKTSKHKIIGSFILIVNIIWLAHWIWLFYRYHFTDALWLFMYPDWILFLNSVFGVVGIVIGMRLWKRTISITAALLFEATKFIIGFFLAF